MMVVSESGKLGQKNPEMPTGVIGEKQSEEKNSPYFFRP
jgi:hypothetical protein